MIRSTSWIVVLVALGVAWWALARDRHREVWWFAVLGGATINGAAFTARAIGGQDPVPSTEHTEWAFAAGYTLFLAGLCGLAARERSTRNVVTALTLEVTAAVCGVATLLWVLIAHGEPTADSTVAFGYMLADVGIGIVIGHLFLTTGRQPAYGWLLALFVVVWTGDVAFLAGGPTSLSVALYVLGYIAAAGAIVTGADRCAPSDTEPLERVWLVAPAAVCLPATMLVSAITGEPVPAGSAVLGVVGGVACAARLALVLRNQLRRAEEMSRLALYDPLTGLPNRRYLTDRLSSVTVDGNGIGALVFIDLDDFKSVNDTFGHASGDQVLEVIADRLRRCVRDSDLVARFAGDEFVVCAQLDEVGAGELTERLTAAVEAPISLATGTVTVGASVGLTLVDPGADATTLLASADEAMYDRKRFRRAAGPRTPGPRADAT